MTDTTANSKVLFRIPEENEADRTETLWATALGNDEYRLENSPFYAYSVSWNDVVRAPYNPDVGFPVFESVSAKSGHRTVRVIFNPPIQDGNKSASTLAALVSLGCTYEGFNRRYVALDLSPGTDLEAVCRYLIDQGIQWEHADPSYEELHPE